MEVKKSSESKHDILLVSDSKDNKIKAVQGLSENGNLKSAPINKNNLNSFLRLDKNGDFFSNFFTNFFSQLKDPTRFSFFKVPENLAISLSKQMQGELDLKNTLNHQLYLSHQVDPKQMIQSIENSTNKDITSCKEYNPYKYNIDHINWESLSQIGLSKEKLEEMDLLEPLLKGYKTKDLVQVNLNLGSAEFSLDARLGLKQAPNGEVVMTLEGVKKYPNLNVPFQGHEFTRQDKHNLLKTGNMGRVVELLDPETNSYIPSVVSVDRLTNNIMVTSVEKMQIPTHIKGVDLSDNQLNELRQGKAVLVKDMSSSKGNPFDAHIQYNASKEHIEFLFDKTNKNKKISNPEDLKVFRGKTLDDNQYKELLEGKTVAIDGLIDKRGKPYKGFINYDKINNRTNFSFTDPSKPKIIESQTQNNKETQNRKKGLKI
ncbi:hypothetical protein HMPREF9711_00928 [Myroides odoratimimus CCUG 3837]|uniref:DUF4099 domain-containing protein n=1 Tax=Myroides odoratimimus TaxID=76832 RepID=UPI000280A2F6|nr:DUF4099 domain-containing protein [Myroides odoratimimus]EKB05959.1 hypothetical protein HMPREF9711_00928 [Myroides odoratimimus CCUG 3837]